MFALILSVIATQTDAATVNYKQATAIVTMCPVGDLAFEGHKIGSSFGSLGVETWTATGCGRVYECKRLNGVLVFGGDTASAQTRCIPTRTVSPPEGRQPASPQAQPRQKEAPELSVDDIKKLRAAAAKDRKALLKQALDVMVCNLKNVDMPPDEVLVKCGGYYEEAHITFAPAIQAPASSSEDTPSRIIAE